MNLNAGLNRPVQSQAVNWATAGLIFPQCCYYEYEYEYVPVVITYKEFKKFKFKLNLN
jgi:hypothetical protein